MAKRHSHDDWATPTTTPRDYVSADAWTHDRPVDALRFSSTTGRPAVRVLLDASLKVDEAEQLFEEILDTLYLPEDEGQ
jgi:hypothetical protein